jgi:integrase
MAKVKYFIRSTKDNLFANIRVRFFQGRSFDTTANSQKTINPHYWNNTKGEVRQRIEFRDASKLQSELDMLSSFIIKEYNLVSNKEKINNEWLKKTIDTFYYPEKYLQNNTTLFGYIQHFINNSDKRLNLKSGNPVCYKMRREYQVTFNYLQEYSKTYKEPDFIDIDLDFYNQFVAYLRDKGLSNNTIGKKIQTLKIFLNTAFEKGINPYTKYKSRSFKTLTEESENVYLTDPELEKLYHFDFSGSTRLDKVRDMFIVACWTGLRFSDLPKVKNEIIKNEFIELRQKKTGDKVSIPVHWTVKEILEKYQGELPKPISNQKFNEYLKEAAKNAGIDDIVKKEVSYKGLKTERTYFKYELIGSHTGRRSFCTNAYNAGIPSLAIMSISGHKTEKAFLKYIKADSKDHAMKVLEAWRKKGNHLRVAK